LKSAWKRPEMHTVLVRRSEVIKTLRCRWLDSVKIDLKRGFYCNENGNVVTNFSKCS